MGLGKLRTPILIPSSRTTTGAQAQSSINGIDKLFVQPGPEPGAGASYWLQVLMSEWLVCADVGPQPWWSGSYEFPVETFARAVHHKGFGTPEVISQVRHVVTTPLMGRPLAQGKPARISA